MPDTVNIPFKDEVLNGLSINTAHLDRLYREVTTSDGTKLGVVDIYQKVPDYSLVFDADEGFTCIDDIARTVVFYCRHHSRQPSPDKVLKIGSLTNTLFYMQAENGYFHNFMLPDLTANISHISSRAVPNFWSWRAMWALSEIQLLDAPALKPLMPSVKKAIGILIENVNKLIYGNQQFMDYDGIRIPKFIADICADQVAVIIMSLTNCYRHSPAPEIKDLIIKLGNGLLHAQIGNKDVFPHYAFMSCKNLWHAWGNNQSYALLYSGNILGVSNFVEAGMNEVLHFFPYLLRSGFLNQFMIRQNNGKLKCSDKKQFPQIAYDIRPMVYAAIEAYNISHEEKFANIAAKLSMWLFGDNVTTGSLYDPKTGMCFDGIDSPTRINKNSGAESTIEALLILNGIGKLEDWRIGGLDDWIIG